MSHPEIFGECRLCLSEGQRIESHIISRFNTRKLYKNRKPKDIVAVTEKGKGRLRPKGHWEYLMCQNCDNNLGNYSERIASQFLYHNRRRHLKMDTDLGSLYRGLPYAQMRVYFLSTLWKMAISSLSYFSSVTLSKELLEHLRIACLNRDPLSGLLPVTLSDLTFEGKRFRANINPARMVRNERESVCLITHGILQEFHIGATQAHDCLTRINKADLAEVFVGKEEITQIPWLYNRIMNVAEANQDFNV